MKERHKQQYDCEIRQLLGCMLTFLMLQGEDSRIASSNCISLVSCGEIPIQPNSVLYVFNLGIQLINLRTNLYDLCLSRRRPTAKRTGKVSKLKELKQIDDCDAYPAAEPAAELELDIL